jgi:hypothetical protein
MTAGSTVAVSAASNAPTTARACPAADSAEAAAALNHPAYGAAAAAIDAADAPCHGPPANPEVTDVNDAAVDPSSADNPSHATAASSKGPDPAPASINAELTSGGRTRKLTAILSSESAKNN